MADMSKVAEPLHDVGPATTWLPKLSEHVTVTAVASTVNVQVGVVSFDGLSGEPIRVGGVGGVVSKV